MTLQHLNKAVVTGTVTRRWLVDEVGKTPQFYGDITVETRGGGSMVVPFSCFEDGAKDAAKFMTKDKRVVVEGRLRYRPVDEKSTDEGAQFVPNGIDLIIEVEEVEDGGELVKQAVVAEAQDTDRDGAIVELLGVLANQPENRSKKAAEGTIFVTSALKTEVMVAGLDRPLIAYHEIHALKSDQAAPLMAVGKGQLISVKGRLDVKEAVYEKAGAEPRKYKKGAVIVEEAAVPAGVALVPRAGAASAARGGAAATSSRRRAS